MKYLLIAFALLSSVCCRSENVHQMKPIANYSSWRVYEAIENNQKVCFISSSPLYSSPKREDAYLMVYRRPSEKEYNIITVMTGVKFHSKHVPTFGIDNQKVVSLFAVNDAAWIKDAKMEKQLINKMIDGNVVRTISKSTKGITLKDTYSLKGFTKALNAMTEACPE